MTSQGLVTRLSIFLERPTGDMIALESRPWQKIAAEKRHQIYTALPPSYLVDKILLQRESAIDIPRNSGILTEKELRITESRAVDLVEQLKNRAYSAVEVTTAFCKRAAIAHQAVRVHWHAI